MAPHIVPAQKIILWSLVWILAAALIAGLALWQMPMGLPDSPKPAVAAMPTPTPLPPSPQAIVQTVYYPLIFNRSPEMPAAP